MSDLRVIDESNSVEEEIKLRTAQYTKKFIPAITAAHFATGGKQEELKDLYKSKEIQELNRLRKEEKVTITPRLIGEVFAKMRPDSRKTKD